MCYIKIKGLSKLYKDGDEVLSSLSLNFKKGDMCAALGSSGSGKTTLLNLIAGIDTFQKGDILVDNRSLKEMDFKELEEYRQKNIGFIFQDYMLFPNLTNRENIGLPLVMNNSEMNINEEVSKVSKLLGIEDILDRYPYEISGGQAQRCSCARAFINECSILLVDEATSALDIKSTQNLMKILQLINRKFNTTIIMSTHDIYSASYCNKIIFLKDGIIEKEISKENDSRREFYEKIMDYVEQ